MNWGFFIVMIIILIGFIWYSLPFVTRLYIVLLPTNNVFKMIDNKSKDQSSTIGSNSAPHVVFDIVRENFVKAIDQMSSVQPQYAQAISNLQLDYIQTVKNVIENTISAQKQFIGNFNIPVSTPSYTTEQFTRQSNEITNNT